MIVIMEVSCTLGLSLENHGKEYSPASEANSM